MITPLFSVVDANKINELRVFTDIRTVRRCLLDPPKQVRHDDPLEKPPHHFGWGRMSRGSRDSI